MAKYLEAPIKERATAPVFVKKLRQNPPSKEGKIPNSTDPKSTSSKDKITLVELDIIDLSSMALDSSRRDIMNGTYNYTIRAGPCCGSNKCTKVGC